MKHRLLALFLCFALVLAPAAQASQALGWELQRTDTQLGPGVVYTTQTFWGDSAKDYRSERYVTYTPGAGSTPVVYYSDTVRTTATVTNMAKKIESWGDRVLAGANGDYFVMASGVPLGLVLTGGVMRSSASYHYAVGFLPDGTAFVGKPDITVTASFAGYNLAVSGGYNKTREAKGGYTLFSSDFGDATRGSGSGVNVVLRPVTVPEDYVAPAKPAAFTDPEPEKPEDAAEGDPALAAWEAWNQAKTQREQEIAQWKSALAASVAGFETLPAQLKVGQKLSCVVESVSTADGAVNIPAGRFVLSIHSGGGEFLVSTLSDVAVGERMDLTVSAPDQRWNQVNAAIGAYAWILKDGAVADGLEAGANPRTAIGIKANGQVVLYTIDGRQPGVSVGATLTQVAKRLIELGCVQGVSLDGGGSTTLGITGALDSAFSLQNKPSDGAQRAVTDALFFTTNLKPTGVLGSLYLQPHSALLLSGAKVSLSARGIDTSYYPMGEEPIGEVTYTAQGPGRMEGNVFVSGGATGTATVTGVTPAGIAGSVTLNVVDTPHAITVSQPGGKALSSLNLEPGQSVTLQTAATWYGLPLQVDNSCYTWTFSGDVATVDAAGTLTAGTKAGSGTLTVTAGSKSVSIPVTVGGHIHTLDGFEGGAPGLTGDSAQTTLVTDPVKMGYQSLEIAYPQGAASALTWGKTLAEGETGLGFWHQNSEALALEFQILTADGQTQSVKADLPAGSDWQYKTVALPSGAAQIAGVNVVSASGAGTGVLYLDQVTSTNGAAKDTTAPAAQLSWSGGTLKATLSDNVDRSFSKEQIKLYLDGWGNDFTLEGNTLTASLKMSSDISHRVSVELQDASGNRARACLDIAGSKASLPFRDIDGHWAQKEITYLAQQGVTNGRTDGTFDPQANITRGEFATMLARWQHADLTKYSAASLPFADAADIPSWAAPAVACLYETGVMTGSLQGDKLYANANSPITRAEAITMLGRTQAKGFEAQTETFSDDGSIPSWAREYVYTLAGEGVVSGYNGAVRPTANITRCEVAKLLTALW